MKYFNFPVKLMQGVLFDEKDGKDFLSDILYYHIYNHYLKLTEIYNNGETLYEETDLQRFKRSADFWDVNLGNISYSFEKGKQLHIQEYKTYVGINTKIFWDFYKNKKTVFDWECLFAHLALKSILGKKEYSKTDNIMLYTRMLGKETKKEYESLKNDLKFTRWHRDKIITELETNWGLKYYSRNIRGFYFGYDIKIEKLIYTAESKREDFKREKLKQTKAEILKQIRNKF